MNYRQTRLIKVYEDTLQAIENQKPTSIYKYKIPEPIYFEIFNIETHLKKSSTLPIKIEGYKGQNIQILNNDCIDQALTSIAKLKEKNKSNNNNNNSKIDEITEKLDEIEIKEIKTLNKVCLLNMASSYKLGGGVLKGATAQEETIFRRSNLYSFLCYKQYPWSFTEIAYSGDVCFFKSSEYEYLSEPYFVDVVSIAAFKGKTQTKEEDEILAAKIRLACQVAQSQKVQILVLSALGCGAYLNNPVKNAKIFYQVLVSEGYGSLFDQVFFSIIDKNTDNFNVFKTVFH